MSTRIFASGLLLVLGPEQRGDRAQLQVPPQGTVSWWWRPDASTAWQGPNQLTSMPTVQITAVGSRIRSTTAIGNHRPPENDPGVDDLNLRSLAALPNLERTGGNPLPVRGWTILLPHGDLGAVLPARLVVEDELAEAVEFTRAGRKRHVYGAALLHVPDSQAVMLDGQRLTGSEPDVWIEGGPAPTVSGEISNLSEVLALTACFDSPGLLARNLFELDPPAVIATYIGIPAARATSNNVFCPPPTYP